MDMPIALYIIKSIALSISLFFVVGNLINVELKPSKFAKYILIVSIPIIFLFLNFNILIFALLRIFLIILAFKIALKIHYKDIIIPTLIAYLVYQLVFNGYSTLLYSIGILKFALNNPIYYISFFAGVMPLTVIVLSYIFKKYLKIHLLTNDLHMISNIIYSLISAFLIFLISLSSFLSPYYTAISSNANTINTELAKIILNIFFITNLVLFYITLKNYFDKQIIELKNQALIDGVADIKELNKDLRSQKHDFFNHLQVISGLLQLKKYNECFNYVVGVYNTDQSRPTMRTGLISINALLNSKQLRAKHKNVRIDLDIATELDSSKFKIDDWEITKVLGNLIDNAIFEETKVTTKDKYVKVKIGEDTDHYSFTVYNKNSFIDQDKRNRIFSSGFSTKGKDGHGMGLYIVKNIVDRYKGKIHLESHIGSGTRFSLFFPKDAELYENKFSKTKSYPPQESLNTQIN